MPKEELAVTVLKEATAAGVAACVGMDRAAKAAVKESRSVFMVKRP